MEQFGSPLATTDTEVVALKFHLVADELEYPDWALFEAFSPTTGDDLALIDPSMRGQLSKKCSASNSPVAGRDRISISVCGISGTQRHRTGRSERSGGFCVPALPRSGMMKRTAKKRVFGDVSE
ncbi:MAG: hypothetical protein R3C26_02600 [Calditrichia bacterium]